MGYAQYTRVDFDAVVRDIIENGGGSYNILGTRIDSEDGYMVSLPGYEVTVPVASFNADAIGQYHEAFVNDRKRMNTNSLIGAWVDGDDVYIDTSIHVPEYDNAIALGRLHNQLAIWDCKNGCEIRLDQ